MKIVNILLVVLAMMLITCEEERVVVEPDVYVEPTLQDINLSGGVATFSHSISGKKELYKVDAIRKITKVPFTFEGSAPNENQASAFEVLDINHPDYFLIRFDSLQQTYFVEKKTGKLHRTEYFKWDMLVTSGGNTLNFRCTQEALYYVKSGGTIQKIKNYLSVDAQIEALPLQSDGAIFVDKDETLFARNLGSLNRYAGGVVTQVLKGKSISSMWVGNDGYFRIIDPEGVIYKVTADAVIQEGAIPISIASLSAHNFPELNKTVGVQYRFNMFHIIELTPPYKSVVSYNAPPPPDGESQEIHISPFKGKLYIHTSARTRAQRLLTIDAADFKKATDVNINNTDRAFSILPLDNNYLLTSICVYAHFSCQEHEAFVNPSGEVDFAFDEGNFYGRFIRL